MKEESNRKYGSKISEQSRRSRNSGSLSLGRPSFTMRERSLSKRASLVYVMSIESDRNSDLLDRLLDDDIQPNISTNFRVSVNEGGMMDEQIENGRSSEVNRTCSHSCDCFHECKGQQCPCFHSRAELCLKDSCCQTCIQMKNSMLMADRGQFCTCKHTQCLKSYCKCFQNNAVCTSLCKCINCQNQLDSQAREQAMQQMKTQVSSLQEQQRKYCTCKKTKCNKKYCWCFANGIKCSKFCSCQGCLNCDRIEKEQMDEEREPSFYKEEDFQNMQLPERMSFQPVQFNHY